MDCYLSTSSEEEHKGRNMKKRFKPTPTTRVLLYPTLHQISEINNKNNSSRRNSHVFPPTKRTMVGPAPKTPPPTLYRGGQQIIVSPPQVVRLKPPHFRYKIINDGLKIYRLQLPPALMEGLDSIVTHTERYARSLPRAWHTNLYSLTKQDIALRDVPGMSQQVRPISDYISDAIRTLYGCRKVGTYMLHTCVRPILALTIHVHVFFYSCR